MIHWRGLPHVPSLPRLPQLFPAALGAVVLATALAIAWLVPLARRARGGPSEGRLAPHRPGWLAPPESVTVRPSPEVGLPSVVGAVARSGDAFFWVDPTGGALFKLEDVRAPDARVRVVREYEPGLRLRRPEGLAVTMDRVWVLDVATRAVFTWTFDLRPAGKLRLRSRSGVLSIPLALGVDRLGRAYVLSREVEGGTGAARWMLVRYSDNGQTVEPLWQAPAPSLVRGLQGLFDAPALAVRGSGEVLLAHAESYRVLALGPSGDTLWVSARRDAPRFALGAEERRSYSRTLGRMPRDLRRRMPRVRFWPAVAWIGWVDGDRWVAAIRAAESAWHVEVVARDGAPLGRLTPGPMSPPPVYTEGCLVQAVVREEDLVLRWHPLRLGAP